MKAIILAGGFGNRLKDVVVDMPKPMADINGSPFLEVLIRRLRKQGFNEFCLSVHHMKEKIIDHFKGEPGITFAIEEEPLGTGGAILNSIKQSGITGNVAVMNGDSYLDIDYKKFFESHGEKKFSIAVREVEDTSRYGRIEKDGKVITDFREKGVSGKGFINTGFYIINAYWMLKQNLPEKFSLENDLLFPRIKDLKPGYFITDSYFIDIGIPEDYERARNELGKIALNKK